MLFCVVMVLSSGLIVYHACLTRQRPLVWILMGAIIFHYGLWLELWQINRYL